MTNRLSDSIFLDENMLLAKLFETIGILTRFNSGKCWAVFAKAHCLHESFTLLIEVPFLEEIDNGDMVDAPA